MSAILFSVNNTAD